MLCDDVKRVVYFFLDGSLPSHKHRDIEIHISNCPDCEVRVVVHKKLRTFFRSRITPVAAPAHLRVRLNRSIRAVGLE